MNRRLAVFVLLGICLVIVLLLLTRWISFIVAALVFAIALVVIGLLSRGFTKS
jgi:hypothetical protein